MSHSIPTRESKIKFISKTLTTSVIAGVLTAGLAYAQTTSTPQTRDDNMKSNMDTMNSTERAPKTPVTQQDRTTGPGDKSGMSGNRHGTQNKQYRSTEEMDSYQRMSKAPAKQQDRTTGPGDRAATPSDRGSIQNQ